MPFQSSALLMENYSHNHWQYCLKYDLNKSRRNCQKQDFFPVILKASISNTNLNKIKL